MSHKFLDLLERKRLPAPVDCGTCPVSIACAAGEGGNGFTFNCCRSTAVEYSGVLLIIDCQNHAFEQSEIAKECTCCPLCSGGIMEVVARDLGNTNRYVPTVHAKYSVTDRVQLWRTSLVTARESIEKERG